MAEFISFSRRRCVCLYISKRNIDYVITCTDRELLPTVGPFSVVRSIDCLLRIAELLYTTKRWKKEPNKSPLVRNLVSTTNFPNFQTQKVEESSNIQTFKFHILYINVRFYFPASELFQTVLQWSAKVFNSDLHAIWTNIVRLLT